MKKSKEIKKLSRELNDTNIALFIVCIGLVGMTVIAILETYK